MHQDLLSATPTSCSAPAGLRVGESCGRGRGVFATIAFAPGDVIERAAVVVVPRRDAQALRGTRLDDYWFWWSETERAVALGCGSLYNHACPANARFEPDPATGTLVFVAVRAIAAGDEVTINYHGRPDDPAPVWFDVAG